MINEAIKLNPFTPKLPDDDDYVTVSWKVQVLAFLSVKTPLIVFAPPYVKVNGNVESAKLGVVCVPLLVKYNTD